MTEQTEQAEEREIKLELLTASRNPGYVARLERAAIVLGAAR